MTRHVLLGRSEGELLWFRRRSVLQAAAAWTALGGFAAAQAQQRGNIVELLGDAQANGRALTLQSTVQTGDTIETGPGANLVFVIGNSAFQVRENTRLVVERGTMLNVVSVLRLFTGGVASVWGKGTSRQIVMPALTGGIRGTGVYTEVFPQQDLRSYLCNCYGVIDVSAGADRVVSRSSYHQSFWGEVQPRNGRMLTPAQAINHTDEEMEFLARLVDQRTAWEELGRRGVKDGQGYMEQRPPSAHPAAPVPAPAPGQR
ncbi:MULTISPECIES: iron dicitrate transport regulator FecR [Ramlibacter]|uniref:Iron dicitrate transport regulator FecR n=1 Tax=Ramlibacter pinisoli TaxID=2682844 RepID=A0A6N8IXR4_9BURK|nr:MULTISPECIES: iron dicitrate transport regulator FecR [Ramlibacter]MBA2961615.1 iron dicitrate transport regulator FecR [Ramlibacter sp. CGMCC 1.13660]MVQ31558.1 iron dicitrate transport regulator FecR [Ramlibacter pinisoli]